MQAARIKSDEQPLPAAGQRLLLVDDDPAALRMFRQCLAAEGYSITVADSRAAAESALSREVFDVCLLDVMLGEDSGIEFLSTLRELTPWMRIIMLTAVDAVDVAVKAIRHGAADYLLKPCTPERLIHAVERQAETRRLEKRIEALESDNADLERVDLVAHVANPRLAATIEMAQRVAATDATVLILGESGTGKNVLARNIHEWSKRAARAFATVSCPSLTGELLASELFGHTRGAFTGAVEHRQGRVQIAEGGTLFLDEIADMPLALQPKLLRFLQDREYERVGDPHTRKADVRVIVASNQDLGAMARDGRFREDLYYRLNVIAFTMPPLRERREDILPMAEQMLMRFVQQYDRPARRIADEAAQMLKAYDWPGNIRELRNVMERAVIVCQGDTLRPEHLPFAGEQNIGRDVRAGDPISLEELERAHITAILAVTPTLEAAARTLGIDGSTLYRKRRQYHMR